MKLSIMQPYFFPYLGYFALIKATDYFVVFDTPQFIRHSWIERNRILEPNKGWQYIKVPLMKHHRDTPIKDIQIRQNEDWKRKILSQLVHYKNKAPYYNEIVNLVKEVIFYDTKSIVDLDVKAVHEVCKYLGIDFSYSIFSKSDIKINEVKDSDEWALEISKSLGADEYYNPPGGMDFFDGEKYQKNNIGLKFLKINLRKYNQKQKAFQSHLSILDVLMFNSVEEINRMLDDIEIIE